MYLINSDKVEIVNLEYVACIYIGADGMSIKVDFSNSKGCQIARYNSPQVAKTAIEMLSSRIKNGESIIYMPSEQEISARIIASNPIKLDRINGKKTKGHGGS